MKLRLLPFFCLLLTPSAFAAEEALPRSQAFQALYPAHALDPRGGTDQTPPIQGALRTSLGLQILPSCLKGAREPMAALVPRIDRWLEEATVRVLTCREKHPELDLHLRQWISKARRMVIDCQPDDLDLIGEDGKKLIRDEAGHYNPLTGVITLNQSYLGVRPNILIHEILHATDADNYLGPDHNAYERIAPGTAGSCGKDAATDRVSVIESLCSGTPLNSSAYHATYELALRMGRCRAIVGCQDMFTRSNFLLLRFGQGDLSETAARSLCQRIKYEGLCRMEALDRFENGSRIRSLLERMQGRLEPLLPRSRAEIPIALVSLFPGIKEGFEALRNSRCFQAVFGREDYHRVLVVPGVEPSDRTSRKGDSFSSLERFPPALLLKDLVDWMSDPGWRAPSLCSPQDTAVVRGWLGELHANLSVQPELSAALAKIIGYHLRHPRSGGEWPAHVAWLEGLPDSRSSSMAVLLGKELLDEYLATIAAAHPSSKDFVCGADRGIAGALQACPR